MRIKIVLTGPSYAQTANIPCEGTDTVEQLKQKLKKRIPQVPAGNALIQAYFNFILLTDT